MPRPRDPRRTTMKKDKFKELAEKRVNAALEKLRLIGNLSDKKSYEYTSGEVQEIIRCLHEEVNHIKKRFEENPDDKGSFKLSSRVNLG
jgi:hypothetical protein